MGTTVLVVLMLAGLGSLLWAVVSVAGWSDAAGEPVEPVVEERRGQRRSLTMPVHRSATPSRAPRSLKPPAPPDAIPEEAPRPDPGVASRQPNPQRRPPARLIHGAAQRPTGPRSDPLAWMSVNHETVNLPDFDADGATPETGRRRRRPEISGDDDAGP